MLRWRIAPHKPARKHFHHQILLSQRHCSGSINLQLVNRSIQPITTAKANEKSTRRSINATVASLNGMKVEIDAMMQHLKGKIPQMPAEGKADGVDTSSTIIDESDYAALQQLQAAKRKYTQLYAERERLLAALEDTEQQTGSSKLGLAKAFVEWYEKYSVAGVNGVATIGVVTVSELLQPASSNNSSDSTTAAAPSTDAAFAALQLGATHNSDLEQLSSTREAEAEKEDPSAQAFVAARRAVIQRLKAQQMALSIKPSARTQRMLAAIE